MENLKSPAYPFLDFNEAGYGNTISVWQPDGGKQLFPFNYGFTKLELAALMISQGNMAQGGTIGSDHIWAARMVSLAKAVLEQANK